MVVCSLLSWCWDSNDCKVSLYVFSRSSNDVWRQTTWWPKQWHNVINGLSEVHWYDAIKMHCIMKQPMELAWDTQRACPRLQWNYTFHVRKTFQKDLSHSKVTDNHSLMLIFRAMHGEHLHGLFLVLTPVLWLRCWAAWPYLEVCPSHYLFSCIHH